MDASLITKNYEKAKCLWCLKQTMVLTVNNIENYHFILDIVESRTSQYYRHSVILQPTRQKKNDQHWCTSMNFISLGGTKYTSEFVTFFRSLLQKMEGMKLSFGVKTVLDKFSEYFIEQCFKYECINMLLGMFCDFYLYKRILSNSCKCSQFLLDNCSCLHSIIFSLRSLIFLIEQITIQIRLNIKKKEKKIVKIYLIMKFLKFSENKKKFKKS